MRRPDIAVISDCHLGTKHCRQDELFSYLHQIRPRQLVINGDLCDLGHYFTRHWPPRHQEILKRILELAGSGTDVIYVIGNHDAPLAGFMDVLPGINLVDEYRCNYGDQQVLFTHGHRFDQLVCGSGIIKRLGGIGYEGLQCLEHHGNHLLRAMQLRPRRWLQRFKYRIPGVRRAIERFEQAALQHAKDSNVDVICCGHIHVPRIIDQVREERSVRYLNSGDWVEHCCAIEASDGAFSLYSAAKQMLPVAAGVFQPVGIEAA